MTYAHLTTDERESIAIRMYRDKIIRHFISPLGRQLSTIYRELLQNRNARHTYSKIKADRKACRRRITCLLL